MYSSQHQRFKWYARRGGAFLDEELNKPSERAYNRLMSTVRKRKSNVAKSD